MCVLICDAGCFYKGAFALSSELKEKKYNSTPLEPQNYPTGANAKDVHTLLSGVGFLSTFGLKYT